MEAILSDRSPCVTLRSVFDKERRRSKYNSFEETDAIGTGLTFFVEYAKRWNDGRPHIVVSFEKGPEPHDVVQFVECFTTTTKTWFKIISNGPLYVDPLRH